MTNRSQEGGSQAAVNNPVIIAQAQIHHMPDGNAIPVWCFYYNRALFYYAYCQDSNLWLIDDWRAHKAAERTDIGKSKCSALRVVGTKPAVPGILGQVVNLFG